MKLPHLLTMSAALLLASCTPNFTGTYESVILQEFRKPNKFAPLGTDFLKSRPSASYLDFTPFKVTLSQNGKTYQGSVEFRRYQKQGLFGMVDDTASVIYNISSTSLSHDTLFFVYGENGMNMKGFVTKKNQIGIDYTFMEEVDSPELNPFMKNKNSIIITYESTKEITAEMRKTLFETQREKLVSELSSASKSKKSQISSDIIYFDSVLIPQSKL